MISRQDTLARGISGIMAANAKSSVLESPFTFCDKKKVVCHKSSVYGSCIRTNGDVNAVVTITLLFPDHLKE